MKRPATAPQVRRLVLVRAAAAPARGDELVRRYRLARLATAGDTLDARWPTSSSACSSVSQAGGSGG